MGLAAAAAAAVYQLHASYCSVHVAQVAAVAAVAVPAAGVVPAASHAAAVFGVATAHHAWAGPHWCVAVLMAAGLVALTIHEQGPVVGHP